MARQKHHAFEKGVKTRPSQNREEIKLFERSEFLILGFDDRVLAFFQPALDLFSIPFFYQEKRRNKGVEGKVFNQYIEPQLRYSFYIEKVISFILSAQNETKRFS